MAIYIRTDPEGTLPNADEQRSTLKAYARKKDYDVSLTYEDLGAPGTLLYHKPALKAAITNIKEEEEWEALLVADPRCISDDASARHELVHKFSLYGNRIESPKVDWESLVEAMRAYRRGMSRR